MANYLIYPSSTEPVSIDPEEVVLTKWYTPLSEPNFTKGQQDWQQFLSTLDFSQEEPDRNPENVNMDKWYTPLSIPLFDTPPPPPQAPRHLDMFAETLFPPPTNVCLMPSRRSDERKNLPNRPQIDPDKR